MVVWAGLLSAKADSSEEMRAESLSRGLLQDRDGDEQVIPSNSKCSGEQDAEGSGPILLCHRLKSDSKPISLQILSVSELPTGSGQKVDP